jgi:hypothetical protein
MFFSRCYYCCVFVLYFLSVHFIFSLIFAVALIFYSKRNCWCENEFHICSECLLLFSVISNFDAGSSNEHKIIGFSTGCLQ